MQLFGSTGFSIPIVLGSCASLVKGGLCASKNTQSQEIKLGPTKHTAFNELDAIHIAFDHAVQMNRLKFVKRQGYGRAKFDLLRLRVLA